jgi:hypothetical protein
LRKVLFIPAVLALAGCSSSPTYNTADSRPYHAYDAAPAHNIHVLGSGDRMPSSAPSDPYWVKQQKNFTVNSQGGSLSFDMVVPMMQDYQDQEPYEETYYTPEISVQQGVCDGYTCTGGAGKSELWNAFYNPKKGDDRAAALDKAIQGVGPATAAKLLAGNYFNSKPKTWDDFVAVIRRAQSDGVIQAGAANDVVVKYRSENLGNLGYVADSCTATTYACPVEVVTQVARTRTAYRTVTKQKKLSEITRSFQVTVTGPKLQSFETDTITVAAGHDQQDVQVGTDGPTQYKSTISYPSPTQAQIEIVGQARTRIPLPVGAIVRATYAMRGSDPLFTLSVDPKYLPAAGGTDQLVVRYTLQTCKTNIAAFGRCFGSYVSQAPVTVPITSADTSIPMKVDKGLRTQVLYTVSRKNSIFYDDSFLQERPTDAFKVK